MEKQEQEEEEGEEGGRDDEEGCGRPHIVQMPMLDNSFKNKGGGCSGNN